MYIYARKLPVEDVENGGSRLRCCERSLSPTTKHGKRLVQKTSEETSKTLQNKWSSRFEKAKHMRDTKKRWQSTGQLPTTLNRFEPFGAQHFGAVLPVSVEET